MFSAKDLFFTPAASGAYQVTKSLRFRSSASAYMNWTPGSAGNTKTFTFSFWVKRGILDGSNNLGILIAQDSVSTAYEGFEFRSDSFGFRYHKTGIGFYAVQTNAVMRDTSAWYHCVGTVDTTQAASADRVKLYINGVQQTVTGTQPDLNYTSPINDAVLQALATYAGAGPYTDFYLAEINFIDGQALDPTSFGAYDTNGVWQPKACTVSDYGKNGYYLAFSNITSTTTLGYDTAPIATNHSAANNWTPNNISLTSGTTYDSMLDSPTNYADGGNGRGNYCTLNPLDKASNVTLSNANLSASCTNTGGIVRGTIGMTSGKWYWEITVTSTAADVGLAAYDATLAQYLGQNARGWGYYGATGNKINNGSGTAYGNTFTTNDVIGIAFDATNGKLFFSKNNTWQNSGDPVAGTNAAFTTGLTTGPYFPAMSDDAGATQSGDFNFGQRPFAYTPPSGYSALNTQNMTTPTITNGASYMAAVLYNGTSASNTVTTSSTNSGNNPLGTTFQPDLVWIKSRSAATDHKLTDAVRGTTKALVSNSTAAETTDTNGLTAFTSSGFTVGSDSNYNNGTGPATYVAWEWKAGTGTTSVPTGGNITVTSASVNASAGFSILKYTGNGSTNQSVPHGLGVAPGMVIVKNLSNTASWCVHHQSQPTGYTVYLNLTNAEDSGSGQWGSSAFTSSLFYVGYTSGATGTNNNTDNYVAYCFAPVSQYSSFGTYTGNGSSDGPFVYTGFRPRWIMVKYTSGVASWLVYDTSRNTYNVADLYLLPNSSGAEGTSAYFDILSNGFKVRTTDGGGNASGGTYIYAAFAENPFTISRAR